MVYLFAIIGFIIGAGYYESFIEGLLFGTIGCLLGLYLKQRDAIKKLQGNLSHVESALKNLSSKPIQDSVNKQPIIESPPPEPIAAAETIPEQPSVADKSDAADSRLAESQQSIPAKQIPVSSRISSTTSDQAPKETPRHKTGIKIGEKSKLEIWINDAFKWFTTGNVVVKVGIVVLFFGVAFLLKFAADNSLLPIEFRIAGVAVGAIALLIVGWRLRDSKRHFALPLQGGAIGLLYMTLFTAAKLYDLLPLTLTFILMLGLVAFSGALAVIQNTRALAVLGMIGGFLAPVLTSSGSGNYVALFSYYAILNAGIFGIAWFKSWRILNWIGFVFTFVIGSLWGYNGYQASHFATTEPFLILFFLFYVFTSVLYAHKQPPHLKGLIDSSLVFGVPLVGFTLQSQLVSQFEFGLAFSSLALSLFYLGLAKFLWHKKIEGMRLLTESFLALGILFGTLCIPFVLDGQWTGATWALEGAGMIWIGLRQQRLLARSAGVLLTVLAGGMFIVECIDVGFQGLSSLEVWLGSAFIAIGGLFSSFHYWRESDSIRRWENAFATALFIWGIIWWLFGGTFFIAEETTSTRYVIQAFLIFFAASYFALQFLAKRFQWIHATYSVIGYLVLLILIALLSFISYNSYISNPFANWGFITWLIAFAILFYALRNIAEQLPTLISQIIYAISSWLTLFIFCLGATRSLNHVLPVDNGWSTLLWAIIPAVILWSSTSGRRINLWPLAHERNHEGNVLFFYPSLLIYLSLWLIQSISLLINPAPLPYILLINPLEITQLIVLLTVVRWLFINKSEVLKIADWMTTEILLGGIMGMFFIWINSVIAHAIHFYALIPFHPQYLFRSDLFQSTISIVWTLLALAGMFAAKRLSQRTLWIVSASLLGLVVGKLFIVDLSDTGTIARIVSFITVGLLMLAIGYLAPIPPKSTGGAKTSQSQKTSSDDKDATTNQPNNTNNA